MDRFNASTNPTLSGSEYLFLNKGEEK